jgi:OOP family OmpA-OmpF porin
MQKLVIAGAVAAALLSGCAMGPSKELSDCLQPNRRVVVELVGTVVPAPKKKAAAKAEAKPEAKKPAAKKKKVRPRPLQLNGLAQGNTAFDPNSAVLKDGGKKDLDKLIGLAQKRKMTINAIVVAGHTDRFEAESASPKLAEERAQAVVAYLSSKGMDKKKMFWEGKGAKEPVPVTKFCEDK